MLKFKLGCYKSYPLTGISSRDSGLASKEIRISLPRLIFSAWPIHCILLVLIFLSQVTLSYISKIFTGCSVQVRSPAHPTLPTVLILLALSSTSSTQICITLLPRLRDSQILLYYLQAGVSHPYPLIETDVLVSDVLVGESLDIIM